MKNPIASCAALIVCMQAATVFGCADYSNVGPADVIQIGVCTSDSDCESTAGTGVADGHTAVRLRVWTPVESHRQAEMKVKITATDGYFPGVPKGVDRTALTVDIGRSGGTHFDWVPGLNVAPQEIQAVWSGFPATATVNLAPAPVGLIEVTPSVVFLRQGENATVLLAITVRGEGAASPSAGTSIKVTAEADATGTGTVQVYPSEMLLDSNFSAKPMLAIPASVNGAVVAITASPAGGPDAGVPAVSTEVQVMREQADAGAEAAP